MSRSLQSEATDRAGKNSLPCLFGSCLFFLSQQANHSPGQLHQRTEPSCLACMRLRQGLLRYAIFLKVYSGTPFLLRVYHTRLSLHK